MTRDSRNDDREKHINAALRACARRNHVTHCNEFKVQYLSFKEKSLRSLEGDNGDGGVEDNSPPRRRRLYTVPSTGFVVESGVGSGGSGGGGCGVGGGDGCVDGGGGGGCGDGGKGGGDSGGGGGGDGGGDEGRVGSSCVSCCHDGGQGFSGCDKTGVVSEEEGVVMAATAVEVNLEKLPS